MKMDLTIQPGGTAPVATLKAAAAPVGAVRRWAVLLGIWGIVTLYNLFKPFHIDDAAHLEIARWIATHVNHPMSGQLNWTGAVEPIWRTNQPHLYFALLALWGTLFGFAEPTMHVLQALASLACVVLTWRLARFLVPASALWATALVILGPAFIVEQNLMVDVPLLAVWLAFFNLLICDVSVKDQHRRFALAGLACAAAVLIKYSSLTLLPILAAALLIERRRPQAWTLLIPIAAILAWSLFNYLDYGQVHMLTHARQAGGTQVLRPLFSGVAWVVGLGALTPLGLIAALESRRVGFPSDWRTYVAVGCLMLDLAAGVATRLLPDAFSDRVLWVLFALNAVVVGAALLPGALILLRLKTWLRPVDAADAPRIYLGLWIAGTSAFYILLSPFIAARHILLILPPVTLMFVAGRKIPLTPGAKVFGLVLTLVVSGGLCLSDWRFAQFYRTEAFALGQSLRGRGPVYASGHWGFQWYAEENGVPEVDVRKTVLKPGALLLIGREVDHQPLSKGYVLEPVETIDQDDAWLNFVCTGRSSRFYGFSYRQAPWSLSPNCMNHIDVWRVVSAPR